jgi:DNA invertase Pin-like site-specific DNA recombinase
MKVALYARISTAIKYERQDTETQLYPLREFSNRHRWEVYGEYVDDVSAVKQRPRFTAMLEAARQRKFDIVLTARLDRAFRSMTEFTATIQDLEHWGVRFMCTEQNIDTDQAAPAGKLLMNIVAAVAEFERTLISERVKAGIERARAQGKPHGGHKRKKVLDTEYALKLYKDGHSLQRIGYLLGCNRNIVARELRAVLDKQ